MPFTKRWNGVAATEALLGGQPVTSLEAILYFGFADVAKKVARLRALGFPVRSRQVSLKMVLARMEEALGARVPAHVCATEFGGMLTEYFIPAAFVKAPGGIRAAAEQT